MMSHRRIPPRLLLAAATVALVAVPYAAAAESPPPDETAAAAVYREYMPTAVGARPSVGAPPAVRSDPAPTGVPLSPVARAAVAVAEPAERETLETVATSPRYGAPTRPLRAPDRASTRDAQNALPAAAGAVSTTDSGRLVALALVLLAVTALLGGIAHRRGRPVLA